MANMRKGEGSAKKHANMPTLRDAGWHEMKVNTYYLNIFLTTIQRLAGFSASRRV